MPPSLTSSSFQDIHNQVDCRQQYFHLASGGPSTRTVIFTIIIILFTVLIEVFANYNFGAVDAKNNGGARDVESVSGSAPSAPQPPPQPLPQAQPQPQPQFDIEDEEDDEIENDAPPTATSAMIASKTAPGFTSCCIPDPSAAVRANRLAAAILLYIPIAIAFHLRISEIEYPKVRYVCIQYLADTMYPNWWAITFLNIIPFISATFALLRTLVDCWLVRYGRSLGYGDMSKCMWVPCMPAGIVFGAVLMVWFVVKLLVSCCMGRPELALGERGKAGKKKKNDVEMQQSEEARRLVDDVDGAGNSLHGDDDDDSDGPPAYETVYDAEASVPAKGE